MEQNMQIETSDDKNSKKNEENRERVAKEMTKDEIDILPEKTDELTLAEAIDENIEKEDLMKRLAELLENEGTNELKPVNENTKTENLPENTIIEETSGDEADLLSGKSEEPDPEEEPAPKNDIEPSQNQDTKGISSEVEKRFQDDFAMTKENLESMSATIKTPEGGEKTIRFSDLTEGQQLLLLKNLKDFALDNAKEQALKIFTNDEKERYEEAGFIKKTWLGFTKTFRRGSEMAQLETAGVNVDTELHKKMFSEVLQEMLAMASEGPEMELVDGKLRVNFLTENPLSASEEKDKIHGFNNAAMAFANVPHEFAYSANETERRRYEEARFVYEQMRGKILEMEMEKNDAKMAFANVASLDKKVQFSQLFNTNPDVEKAFAKTKNQEEFLAGMKAVFLERGKLMALGRTVRTLGMAVGTAAAIGSGLGAPMAAALLGGALSGSLSGGVIGSYMARKRAGQEIEDKKNLAKIGITDESNKEDFRSATETKTITGVKKDEKPEAGIGLTDKLEYAFNRLAEKEDSDEKDTLAKILANRIQYTEKKLAMGAVSFGEGLEGFKNRYDLTLALAKAQTLCQMTEPQTDTKIKKKIDDMLDMQEKKIKNREETEKYAKMRQGAKYGILLGGTFGAILASITSEVSAHDAVGAGVTQPKVPTPATSSVNTHPFVDETLTNSTKISQNTGGHIINPDFLTESVPGTHSVDEVPNPYHSLSFLESPESPKNYGWGGTSEETEIPSPQAPSQVLSFQKTFANFEKSYTVEQNDNLWNILKHKLAEDETFKNLSAHKQNTVIANIEAKIAKMSPDELHQMGIRNNPNLIYAGDKIDFSKVFTGNSNELESMLNRGKLPPLPTLSEADFGGAEAPTIPTAGDVTSIPVTNESSTFPYDTRINSGSNSGSGGITGDTPPGGGETKEILEQTEYSSQPGSNVGGKNDTIVSIGETAPQAVETPMAINEVYKTLFKSFDDLPESEQSYIIGINGQLGSDREPQIWKNMLEANANEILKAVGNSNITSRIAYLLNTNKNIISYHSVKLKIENDETLGHYIAKLSDILWKMNKTNPPSIAGTVSHKNYTELSKILNPRHLTTR